MSKEQFNLQFNRLRKNMNSNKNLRNFLQGIQFFIKAKGLKISLYAPSEDNRIVKGGQLQPNLVLDIDGFNLYLSLFNDITTSSLVMKLNMS